jgi:hypothetical protein
VAVHNNKLSEVTNSAIMSMVFACALTLKLSGYIVFHTNWTVALGDAQCFIYNWPRPSDTKAANRCDHEGDTIF